MKLYFRMNNLLTEYSLSEFDKEGSFVYNEFDIPEYYSEEEAEALCETMVNNFKKKGTNMQITLQGEVRKKLEFIESMKGFKKFKVVNSNVSFIHISVYMVYRGNFNDERLIDSIDINVDELKNKYLVWYDLYLNKNDNNKIKIAPVYLEGNDLYFLEDNNRNINVVKKDSFTKCYSEDFDERYIISTQIYCSSKNN